MDSKKEQFDMILEKLQSLIADQLGVDGNTITMEEDGAKIVFSKK